MRGGKRTCDPAGVVLSIGFGKEPTRMGRKLREHCRSQDFGGNCLVPKCWLPLLVEGLKNNCDPILYIYYMMQVLDGTVEYKSFK